MHIVPEAHRMSAHLLLDRLVLPKKAKIDAITTAFICEVFRVYSKILYYIKVKNFNIIKFDLLTNTIIILVK